ncbi:STY4528 family pathogenicity island replication protein [Klebsiella pneumoniae]|uniref:STY4528 family pathogenicity island replication protein n=1 Tax=Klebsiella pneumoniae TaxID=573 RepID=UPI00094F4B31|nr:STY4528 family pathogenicity island replication protein [Klebsiella pneumoniae]
MQFPPDSIIQFSLEKMRQQLHHRQHSQPGTALRSGLIYAGNVHDAIPRQLLLESRLSPVDKLTWMMIRLHAQQNEGAVFPTYDDLQLQLATPHSDKASRETVSRALLMLRLTGWLSLCHRVRDKRGRIRGNIYMLHDEPVNAFDAETLDPRWMDVLEKSCYHKNKSVRCVARAALTALKTEPSMRHQHTRMQLIEQRLESLQTPEALADRQCRILNGQTAQLHPGKHKKNRAQCKTPDSKIELREKNDEKKPGTKIELSTQTQSDSGVRKSNCYVRNTFTQSVKNTYVDQGEQYLSGTQVQGLHQWIDENDRQMLEKQLQALPEEAAISIVQQLTQGVRTGSVRNPVGYALQLLKAAREGRYHSVSPAETGMKSASLQKMSGTPDVSQHTQTKPERTERSKASQGGMGAPDIARQYLQRFRRTLIGISNEQ